jgi:hypothetical protein
VVVVVVKANQDAALHIICVEGESRTESSILSPLIDEHKN